MRGLNIATLEAAIEVLERYHTHTVPHDKIYCRQEEDKS